MEEVERAPGMFNTDRDFNVGLMSPGNSQPISRYRDTKMRTM